MISERRDDPAALREPDVEQVGRPPLDRPDGVGIAAERLVEHHRHAQAAAGARPGRRPRRAAPAAPGPRGGTGGAARPGRRPRRPTTPRWRRSGCPSAGRGSAGARRSRAGSSWPVDADLDLDLGEPVEPHLPGRDPLLLRRSRP